MTAALSIPDPVPSWSIDAAANDGPTAPWAPPGGFSTAALGDTRACMHTPLAAVPTRFGRACATELGAQIGGRLDARWQDGTPYAGDLWLDILDYRELRMRSFGEVSPGESSRRRLSALERSLQTSDRTIDGGGARRFTRFSCRRWARVSGADATAIDAMVVDVSAGGAKLERLDSDETLLLEGAEVALHVEAAGGPADIVLPARVVWIRGRTLGIMFAGAPRKAG